MVPLRLLLLTRGQLSDVHDKSIVSEFYYNKNAIPLFDVELSHNSRFQPDIKTTVFGGKDENKGWNHNNVLLCKHSQNSRS